MLAEDFIAQAHDPLNLDYSEPLEVCAQMYRTGFRENIDRAAAENGSPWPPHAPATVARYGPHPLLILSRRMLASLVGQSADGNVTRVDRDSLEVGTAVTDPKTGFFYPEIQQHGGSRIPQREFLYATESIIDRCVEIVADFTVSHMYVGGVA